MNSFSGKRILVTGSTRGIGRAIAFELLKQGAIVGIHGRDRKTVESVCLDFSANDLKAVPIACDFSVPAEAGKIVNEFVRISGGLDGLVNNAGIGKAVAFRGISIAKWRELFAVNVESAFEVTRESYSLMRQQKHGAIVNIASISAHGPGKWMGADYAASKASIVSLTRSLAFEAARYGIRVNAVSPGIVETDMTAVLTDDMKRKLNIPMGRVAVPYDVVGPVLFLLSEASSYITGEVIHVNGGMDIQH